MESDVHLTPRSGPVPQPSWEFVNNNNNNNNKQDDIYGAVIVLQALRDSSPGSSGECRLERQMTANTRPDQAN